MELISTVRFLHISPFLLQTNPFRTGRKSRIVYHKNLMDKGNGGVRRRRVDEPLRTLRPGSVTAVEALGDMGHGFAKLMNPLKYYLF
jgi:hypothetical protein